MFISVYGVTSFDEKRFTIDTILATMALIDEVYVQRTCIKGVFKTRSV